MYGARMRSETLRSSKFAVLAVAAIVTTYVCVWRAPHRTLLARAKPLLSSDAPVTGIHNLDAELRKSWMFSGGRGAFPYGEKGGNGSNGKAGELKVGDMNPEELRKDMGRVDSALSASASVAPAAAEAMLAGHCYSLHKPKICPRNTKANSRTAPDGSVCTNAVEDHVDEHVWEALPGWCDSSLPWPPGADPLGFLLRCAPATGSAAEALSRSGPSGRLRCGPD